MRQQAKEMQLFLSGNFFYKSPTIAVISHVTKLGLTTEVCAHCLNSTHAALVYSFFERQVLTVLFLLGSVVLPTVVAWHI